MNLHTSESSEKNPQTILHEVLDPTTLSVTFDHLCLSSLDAELLYDPNTSLSKSFMDDDDDTSSTDTCIPGVEPYPHGDSWNYMNDLSDWKVSEALPPSMRLI